MDDKITIIEGPTPTFEPLQEDPLTGMQAWTAGILESPFLYDMAHTTLRTFNSWSLVERCKQTWQNKSTMYLEYRDRIGLTKQTPILAARAVSVDEGDLLILWVRRDPREEETETDFDDEFDNGFEN
jgi:hypothetical protein